MTKPKIIKESKRIEESGCCFTSCGGSPAIITFDPKEKKTEKKFARIK